MKPSSGSKTGVGEAHPDRELRQHPAEASTEVSAPDPAEDVVTEPVVEPVVDLSDPMTDDEIAALLAQPAHDVIDIVCSADRRGGRHARDLDALETAELAGKARKTVLEAIHDRRTAITNL